MDSAAHSIRIGRNLGRGSVPAWPNYSRPKTIAKEFDRSWRSANRTSLASERALLQVKTFVALRRYFRTLGPIGGSRVRIEKNRARLTRNIPANKPSVGAAEQRATADLVGVRHPFIFRLRRGYDA